MVNFARSLPLGHGQLSNCRKPYQRCSFYVVTTDGGASLRVKGGAHPITLQAEGDIHSHHTLSWLGQHARYW